MQQRLSMKRWRNLISPLFDLAVVWKDSVDDTGEIISTEWLCTGRMIEFFLRPEPDEGDAQDFA